MGWGVGRNRHSYKYLVGFKMKNTYISTCIEVQGYVCALPINLWVKCMMESMYMGDMGYAGSKTYQDLSLPMAGIPTWTRHD